MPAPFRVYNTLTRTVEQFSPQQPGHIGLYVCGMTVYDRAHVGHARAFVVFDAFVRYLRHRGWDVTFVRNFTDVDDKIIARAAETGQAAEDLAAQNILDFIEDTNNLGLVRPDHEPKVSTSIAAIQDLINALVDSGHAYVSDGSVWFSVRNFESYGKLSGQKVDELRSPDEVAGKADPADFALWKAAKPGEPTWDSPWGPGRPGWHIECSAMSKEFLGKTFDIHGGGLDLVFPHHENEIAQSECGNCAPYAKYWMHNGLLTVSSGAKMGKSLGNAYNLKAALDRFPAEAMRLYYLQSHYRSPLPFDDAALPEALQMLCRLYEAREVAEQMGGDEPATVVADALGNDAKKVLSLAESFGERFLDALDDDFNTSQALGYVFEMCRAINRLSNHKKARKRGGPVVAGALAALRMVTETLGLLGADAAAFAEEVKEKRLPTLGVTRVEVDALIAQRATARANKDWATADEIRDKLTAHRIVVMDSDGGVSWRIAL